MFPDKVRISINVHSDEFNSFLCWLESNDPSWAFHYDGSHEEVKKWHERMAAEGGMMTWHLFLDPKAAMLARLSWDTWMS